MKKYITFKELMAWRPCYDDDRPMLDWDNYCLERIAKSVGLT